MLLNKERHCMEENKRGVSLSVGECDTLLFSQFLQLFLHIRILKFWVIVAADGMGEMSNRRWGSVAVHCNRLAARWFRALLTFASSRASQEGDRPLNEVTSAVLSHSVSSWSSLSRRKGKAAAVFISRVIVNLGFRTTTARACSVNSLGSRDVTWGGIRTGGWSGMVEVWRGRGTRSAGKFGRSRALRCSCHRCFALQLITALFPVSAPSLTARSIWTTRGGCRAATCFAFISPLKDLWLMEKQRQSCGNGWVKLIIKICWLEKHLFLLVIS